MKSHRLYGEAAGFSGRLMAAFMLLILAFSANADDCFSLYTKSGATPGSKTCKLDVTSNTPGGMGNYACINDFAQIDQWCSGADTPPDDTCPVADPVFPANGIVTLSETDFVSGDTSPLVFSRSYLSKPFDKTQTAMGGFWVSNWQRRLDLTALNASAPKIAAYRGNGQPLIFKWVSGAWAVPGASGLSLTKAGDGYFYLKDERLGTTEAYSDSTGLFYSETTRTGVIRKVIYDGKQRLSSIAQWPVDNVTPQTAISIRMTYDSSDRIVMLVDPLGMPTTYAYDGKGNLVSVTAPYDHVRQYLYEDVRFPNALTGVKDESGSRIATWTYDSSGRAISVTHPDTTRNVSLSYGSSVTTVSSMSGSSTYSFIGADTSRPSSIVTAGGTVSRTPGVRIDTVIQVKHFAVWDRSTCLT
jgi:YD repeat-containing protein